MWILLLGKRTCSPHPALHELDGDVSEDSDNDGSDNEEDNCEGGAESLAGLLALFLIFFTQLITELGEHKLLVRVVETIALCEVVGFPLHYCLCLYDY